MLVDQYPHRCGGSKLPSDETYSWLWVIFLYRAMQSLPVQESGPEGLSERKRDAKVKIYRLVNRLLTIQAKITVSISFVLI